MGPRTVRSQLGRSAVIALAVGGLLGVGILAETEPAQPLDEILDADFIGSSKAANKAETSATSTTVAPKPPDHPGFNGDHTKHCTDGKGEDDVKNPFCRSASP